MGKEVQSFLVPAAGGAKGISQSLQLAAAFIGGPYLVAAALVSTYAYSREEQRRARNRARDAYNNSLRDRYVMVRSAIEPRQMVLGRQRVSGPLIYVGSYGADREHLVFAFPIASHETDAIEAIYFDDELVTLDGSGNVLAVNRRDFFSISTSGATFTLSSAPKTGTVAATVAYGTTTVSLGVSVAGSAVTVSGATAGQVGTVTITYQPAVSPFIADSSDTLNTTTITLNGAGTGSVALSGTPTSGQVFVTYQPPDLANGTPPLVDLAAFVSVAGSAVTVTGATDQAGQTVQVVWAGAPTTRSRARVRSYLGAPGQAADAGMIAALPGIWTSAHTMSGMSYLVVELDFDPDAFPNGLMNVSALIRGAKLYDPRTGSTAWSENPVLMMRYTVLSPLFGGWNASAVDDNNQASQATVCDTSSSYVVQGQTYVRPLYTAGITAKASQRPKDVLDELAKAMAGKWTFVDGQLRVKAGAYSAPVAAIDESWLTDLQAPTVQPTAALTDVFNTVTGRFLDAAQDYREVAFPSVISAEYVAADGRSMPEDYVFGAVNFSGQAQQLAAVALRDARQGVRCTLSCNLRAFPLEVFDTVSVTLPRFGWSAKVFEVLDISWSLDGGILLQLKETTPTIWALGTSFSAQDPAPNTLLPNPASVPTVTLNLPLSGTAQLLSVGDGTVISRIYVSWVPITDAYVVQGGGVEVEWGPASANPSTYQRVRITDGQSGVFLGPVQDGNTYLIRARAFNRLADGAWSAAVKHTVVGKTALPANVSGLTATALLGTYAVTWTPNTEADYAETEVRIGASWAAGTRVFIGPADRFSWPRPAVGSYTLRAKHRDTTGNESATDATVSVSVGLPANVSGLSTSAIPGGVLITVTPSAEAHVRSSGYLEIRVGGANWAGATRIFRDSGSSDRYTWPWPAAGTYTIRAKWIDADGNESASDSTASVTVGNGNLVPTGGLQTDAATETVFDTQNTGSLTATTSTDISTTVLSKTWTNTTGSTVQVQCEANIYGAQSGGTGTCYYNIECFSSLGAGMLLTGPPITTAESPRLLIQQFALPNGETATSQIIAHAQCTGGGSTTNSWRAAAVRITVIKR